MKLFKVAKKYAKAGLLTAAAAAGSVVSTSALAIDTAAVQTALTAAQTDGNAVGGMVVAVVASLAVVGVIIALVRKI